MIYITKYVTHNYERNQNQQNLAYGEQDAEKSEYSGQDKMAPGPCGQLPVPPAAGKSDRGIEEARPLTLPP